MWVKMMWERFRCWLETCYFDVLKDERQQMEFWDGGRYYLSMDPERVVGPFTENMRGLDVVHLPDGYGGEEVRYKILGPYNTLDLNHIRLWERREDGTLGMIRDVDMRVDIVRYVPTQEVKQ